MPHLILKSYLTILLAVGAGFCALLIMMLVFVIKKRRRNRRAAPHFRHQATPVTCNKKPPLTITSQDISAIAGEDVLTTQLDLARAYIETDRKKLAKKILEYVLLQGSPEQQEEAKQLLNHI